MWDSVEKDQTTLLMLTPVCINISKHNVNLIYMSALFENIASYLNEKKKQFNISQLKSINITVTTYYLHTKSILV